MAVKAHARNLVLIGAAALAMALSGCGMQAAPGSGAAGGASGGKSTPATAKVELKFTVTNGTGKAPTHWTLRCEPTGGTHPDPARTCATLLGLKQPFAPPAKHMMCPMIMVSDRVIKVSGTWFGKTVHRVLVDGGCDLSVFTKIDQVMH